MKEVMVWHFTRQKQENRVLTRVLGSHCLVVRRSAQGPHTSSILALGDITTSLFSNTIRLRAWREIWRWGGSRKLQLGGYQGIQINRPLTTHQCVCLAPIFPLHSPVSLSNGLIGKAVFQPLNQGGLG
jgi:hypothetical protein